MPLDTLAALCLATRPPTPPEAIWRDWSLAPEIVVPLVLALALYLRGAAGRRAWEVSAFAAGWLLLVLALVSPLCRMSASLASAHMVQHVVLVALAPPLLVLGGAGPAVRGGLRVPLRRLPGPAAASLIYAAAIWLSHLRPIYQAALTDPLAHLAVLALLLAAALLFWAVLAEAAAGGMAMMMALGALLQTGLLGALLTFAPTPWYPVFAGRPLAWGMTPLEDQQLAGLIMWVPMGAVYLVAGIAALGRVLVRLERAGRH